MGLRGRKMSNLTELTKSSRMRTWIAYVTIFLMLIVSAAFVFGINRRPHNRPASQVLNKTSALEVVSAISGQDNALTVTVKNVSSKTITGLVIKSENVQVETDLISGFGDYIIPPGKTYWRTFQPHAKAGVVASDVSIIAAVFDDRSIDGDTEMGQRLLDRRKGKREQLQLILPAIKTAIDSNAVNKKIALAVANINQIPHPHEVETQPYIKAGAHSIRELVLSKIQDHVNTGALTTAEENQALKRIYDEYSRLMSKL